MVVSLTRMLKSFGQSAVQGDEQSLANHSSILPPIHYPSNLFEAAGASAGSVATNNPENTAVPPSAHHEKLARDNQQLRAKRVVEAVQQVRNHQSPTPLTDRYLAHRQNFRHPNRPPFAAATLWQLKHGTVPIMTELVNVVDVATLNAMPIEAVAILDRINQKLGRYREWSEELHGNQEEWVCERQYVIDKLIAESIPEALSHYEQLLRFSPHRTKNNTVQGAMTAGDMLTDLFLEIDYELDELLDELHSIVLNRLASTHRYVKSRTQH